MEENAIQINPELAKRCLQSAHLLMEKSRFQEAIDLFDEVIGKHQPQNVEAHLESAKIYARFKKPNSILKVINRLHHFSPKTPESQVLLARAQFLLGLYADCQDTLKEVFPREGITPRPWPWRLSFVSTRGNMSPPSRSLSPYPFETPRTTTI